MTSIQLLSFRLVFLLGMAFSFSLSAQENNTTSFQDSELKTFVKIYTETKGYENNVDVAIISLLQEYNVSYARYRDIITSQIEGKSLEAFNENEKRFFDAVKQKNAELKEKVTALEKSRCAEEGMSHKRYTEIKEKFLSSPAFQNQLYPYFQKTGVITDDK